MLKTGKPLKIFTISSDDIVFLKEGILWATIDMRVSGVDISKKIQLPYYIKYREGAISTTLVTIEDVETVVDEKIRGNVESQIADLRERISVLENLLSQYQILTVNVTPSTANLNIEANE